MWTVDFSKPIFPLSDLRCATKELGQGGTCKAGKTLQHEGLILGSRPKSRQAVESRCNAAFPQGDARTGESRSTCPKVTAQVANPQCDARFDMASQQKENSMSKPHVDTARRRVSTHVAK